MKYVYLKLYFGMIFNGNLEVLEIERKVIWIYITVRSKKKILSALSDV